MTMTRKRSKNVDKIMSLMHFYEQRMPQIERMLHAAIGDGDTKLVALTVGKVKEGRRVVQAPVLVVGIQACDYPYYEEAHIGYAAQSSDPDAIEEAIRQKARLLVSDTIDALLHG
jgi:hypothetical protein